MGYAFHRAACAAALLLTIAAVSSAQTAPAPPPLKEGSADFAFVGTTGNSSTQTIGLGGEFIYRPSPWETKLKVNYVRNEAEDQLRAQSLVFLARAQRALNPRLAAYAQYGYQRDRFAGILNRNVFELGLAYALVDQTPHKLVVDAAFGYANEQRLLGSNLSTGTFGAGGLYTLKMSQNADLTEDAHLLFSMSQGSDWRFVNSVAVTAKVASVFSLKVANMVRYLNLPTVGFKNTDAVTSVALVAKF
jgi:putative salt-induced outer membrane protein YdiY